MKNSYSDIILLFIGFALLIYYIFFMIKNDLDLKNNSYVLEPNSSIIKEHNDSDTNTTS